ncbi:hypothetical protein ACFLSQ_01200, partial [Bacteroidota bacterium]
MMSNEISVFAEKLLNAIIIFCICRNDNTDIFLLRLKNGYKRLIVIVLESAMKIYILIFPFLLIILLSCDDSSTNNNQTINDYFPLQVGNEWHYYVENRPLKITYKVTGKIDSVGHQYFIVDFNSIDTIKKIGKSGNLYYRTTDRKKIFILGNDGDQLFRDFSDNISDSNYINNYNYWNVDSVNIPWSAPTISDTKLRYFFPFK